MQGDSTDQSSSVPGATDGPPPGAEEEEHELPRGAGEENRQSTAASSGGSEEPAREPGAGVSNPEGVASGRWSDVGVRVVPPGSPLEPSEGSGAPPTPSASPEAPGVIPPVGLGSSLPDGRAGPATAHDSLGEVTDDIVAYLAAPEEVNIAQARIAGRDEADEESTEGTEGEESAEGSTRTSRRVSIKARDEEGTAGRQQTRAEMRRARRGEGPGLRESRLLRWVAVFLCIAIVAAAIGVFVGLRLSAAPRQAAVKLTLPAQRTVHGSPPTSLPWPSVGQSAVSIPAVGYAAQSGPEHPVPVASLTKIMTAYVVLREHPLPAGTNGPNITMSPTDVAEFNQATAAGETDIPVTAGEVLSLRQLLQGLLVHSADNLAVTLAQWDAGTQAAFVDKMNATAKSLGLTQTHFADAAGVSAQSVSTPRDILKLTALAMNIPAFAETVAMPTVTLPDAGTLDTYTQDLNVPGVVGVKSGFTLEAGGCEVLALNRTINGKSALVLTAVLGEPGTNISIIGAAGSAALDLANAAAPSVTSVPLTLQGARVGTASVNGASTSVVSASSVSMLAWPGRKIREWITLTHPPRAGSPAGLPIGAVHFATGNQQASSLIHTTGALPRSNLLQRLF